MPSNEVDFLCNRDKECYNKNNVMLQDENRELQQGT